MGLGALLMALASVGYFFAPGFAAIAACEFCFAAGLTLTSGADSAFLYDQLQAANREGEYLQREANASAAKYVGLGVAAAAGGVIVHLVSMQATFLVTAAASLGAFATTLLFPGAREPGFRAGDARSASVGVRIAEAVRTVRTNRSIWYVILFSSLIFVLVRLADTLFQPVLKNQGFNEVGVGFAFAGLSFVAAAAALRLGRLSWERWEAPILWSLPLLLATTYVFVSLFGPFMAVALMVPHFMVTGVYSPVMKTLINQQVTDSGVRATVLSAESAIKRLVMLGVTPVIGLIFRLTEGGEKAGGPSAGSMRPALLVCGGIALLALLAHYLYRRHRRPAEAQRERQLAAPPEGVRVPAQVG